MTLCEGGLPRTQDCDTVGSLSQSDTMICTVTHFCVVPGFHSSNFPAVWEVGQLQIEPRFD